MTAGDSLCFPKQSRTLFIGCLGAMRGSLQKQALCKVNLPRVLFQRKKMLPASRLGFFLIPSLRLICRAKPHGQKLCNPRAPMQQSWSHHLGFAGISATQTGDSPSYPEPHSCEGLKRLQESSLEDVLKSVLSGVMGRNKHGTWYSASGFQNRLYRLGLKLNVGKEGLGARTICPLSASKQEAEAQANADSQGHKGALLASSITPPTMQLMRVRGQ